MELNSKVDIVPLKNEDYCDDFLFETRVKVNNIEIEVLGAQKCGEIFISGNNGFSFLCKLCDILIPDFEDFGAHINQSHCQAYYRDSVYEKIKDEEEDSVSIIKHKEEISKDSCDDNIDNNIELQSLNDCGEEKGLDQEKNSTDTLENLVSNKKRNKKKNKICEICNAAFFTQKSLDYHITYDHKPSDPFYELETIRNQPDLLSEDSEKEENKKRSEIKLHDPLQCRYCDRRLKSRRERAEHECIHTGERLYKCEICNKHFRLHKSYDKHVLTHRDNRKRYECELCNASYTDKSNLLVHTKMHKGDKRYKCDYCGKLFVQNTQRRTHERIHTGEKPFQCNTCGKCFTTSGKLCLHNKRHFGIKPYKCEHCEKSFYSKHLLKNHSVTHTNERPYSCEICEATFPRKQTLKAHKKLHSDATQYICKICGKGFKQGPGLYSHMKTHGETLKNF